MSGASRTTSLLYSGEVVLEFHPASHKYYLTVEGDRIRVPSVTTVCGVIDKSGPLIAWAVNNALAVCQGAVKPDTPYPDLYLEQVWNTAKRAYRDVKQEAANIGSEAHQIIEEGLKRGGPILSPDEGPVGHCIHAVNEWMGAHSVRVVEVERVIYSRKWGYTGTLDCIAYVDDELCLIDWKSSKAIYVDYWLQTSAYSSAYQEETGTPILTRHIVRLGKEDGEFEVQTRSGLRAQQQDFKTFRAALDLTKGLEKLKRTI